MRYQNWMTEPGSNMYGSQSPRFIFCNRRSCEVINQEPILIEVGEYLFAYGRMLFSHRPHSASRGRTVPIYQDELTFPRGIHIAPPPTYRAPAQRQLSIEATYAGHFADAFAATRLQLSFELILQMCTDACN